MPRAHRPHAPGNAFHITARTQGKAKWFTPSLRDDVVSIICDAAHASTTDLIAYQVMPSHLHLVLRQGAQPLGWMMQRVLQRTALLVRNARGLRGHGHVFGYRYWSGLLDSPRYIRQAIIYTHLNSYYARLCADPADWRWSSHGVYIDAPLVEQPRDALLADHGLALFASDQAGVTAKENYVQFIRYWMKRKRLPVNWKFIYIDDDVPDAPRADAGDVFWFNEYSRAIGTGLGRPIRNDDDVRDRSMAALRSIAPDLTLQDLRSCGRVKQICAVRRQVIARLLAEDCRNGAVARCVNVSPAHVSVIQRELRQAHAGSPER